MTYISDLVNVGDWFYLISKVKVKISNRTAQTPRPVWMVFIKQLRIVCVNVNDLLKTAKRNFGEIS